MSGHKASVVVCIPQGPTRDAVRAALAQAGFFNVLGVAKDGEDLKEQLSVHYPDLVVVDSVLCPEGAEAFVMLASSGRPVATLELVDRERSSREPGRKRTQHVRLGKDVLLKDDLVAQNHVWARLLAMADHLTLSRHTQTASKLDDLIRGVRLRARHSDHRPEVVALATWPLDLIVVVGDSRTQKALPELLEMVPSSRVPILLAVEGGVDPQILRMARIPVKALETTTKIRRCEGLVVASGRVGLRVTSEELVVDPSADFTALDLLQSTASLEAAAFAVLLSHHDPDVAMGLGTVVNGGGLVAIYDSRSTVSSEGPQAAISWGLTDMALDARELAWVIEQAVPRRR